MTKMRIIEVDGEAAVIFPEEMISALGLKEGDTLIATPDDGGLKIAVDRDHEGQD
jgi:hypothetical protein